ncbi:MAG: phosphoribosylglycinamide synthetase C domain-containing protein, partial [Armatimonadota bacterium]
LAEAMLACCENRLADCEMTWSDDHAVCVVMASGGYPGSYEKGKVITGIDAAEETGALVFHAGTRRQGDDLVTAGGRVLGVTAMAPDTAMAVERAYAAVDRIEWEDVYYRRDIAYRALQRL